MHQLTCSNSLMPISRQFSTSVASMVLVAMPAVLSVCLKGWSRSEPSKAVLPTRASPSKTRKARSNRSLSSVTRNLAHLRCMHGGDRSELEQTRRQNLGESLDATQKYQFSSVIHAPTYLPTACCWFWCSCDNTHAEWHCSH